MKKYNRLFVFLTIISIGCQSPTDRILFSSDRNGNSDIFLMNSKGEILEQLTADPSEQWAPVWVNSYEIAYLSQDEEEITIVLQNLETKEKAPIKHPENCLLDDKNFVYSTALKKQVYTCGGDVYVSDQNTQVVENLTADLSGTANYVAWVNDREAITFTSNHEGNNEIYLLNLTTRKLQNVTNNKANDERGEVSYDGKHLVFSSSRFQDGNQDILIQNLETQEILRVTETRGTELIARWSLDDERIYFGSNEDGNWELYVFDIRDYTTIRLTNNEGFDGDPRVN